MATGGAVRWRIEPFIRLGGNNLEREVILSDGRRLAATEKNGAGDTLVVLVHGWCCRRSDWHAYLESAPETVSFLAPDLPGHGDSASTPGTWTVAGMARDLAAMVNARRPARVVLVGHSMGGAVALEAAALLESVAAVVFVDTFIIPYGDLSEDDAAGIEGGFHEELNRRSSELARPRGIEVVDPTELTRRLRPDGFRMSDARGRGGSEGDVYHGYPPFDLVTDVVQRMCDGCARQQANMYER